MYADVVKHYERIIEFQNQQIEILNMQLLHGRRANDPAGMDPAPLRKKRPF